MNDQLQKALADILNHTAGAVSAGADFLQAQLPDVIQQLLLWKMAASALHCLFGVLLLVVLAASMLKWWKWAERKEAALVDTFNRGDFYFPFVMLGGFISLGTGGLAFSYINFKWLQIMIAPKIFLIEYAASLAK